MDSSCYQEHVAFKKFSALNSFCFKQFNTNTYLYFYMEGFLQKKEKNVF